MEELQQINWSCIEITKTKKRFIGTVTGLSGHFWENEKVILYNLYYGMESPGRNHIRHPIISSK